MYWTLYPKIFQSKDTFNVLYNKLKDLCKPAIFNIEGKTLLGKRVSCCYTVNRAMKGYTYSQTPLMEWKDAPKEIIEMKDAIYKFFDFKADYVLIHIYRDWDDKIAWHADREALNKDIFSVSLGSTRRFMIKSKTNKLDNHEYMLEDGDLFHMMGPKGEVHGCQELYIHCIPEMTMKDMLHFINEHNLEYNGLKRKENVLKFLKEKNLKPIRINLTFRQFD